MTDSWEQHLAQAASEYARLRDSAIETQRQLQSLSATATSRPSLVTVTVGPQGELRALVFTSRAYRQMAPAELSHVILDTIGRARQSLMRQVVDLMPAMILGGASVEDIVAGRFDVSTMLPERLTTETGGPRATRTGEDG